MTESSKDKDRMPTPLTIPYPPLILIESDEPLTWQVLITSIGGRIDDGVSICLQASTGNRNRGGFFFHLKRTQQGVTFRTFNRDAVLTLVTEDEVIDFVNHVSGRLYNRHMWEQAQLVNLRSDGDG
jgi:hypothetical protein